MHSQVVLNATYSRLEVANQLTCEQYFDHVNILKPLVLQRKHPLNFFH